MTFTTLMLILAGFALLFSAVEDKPISTYLKEWLGSSKQ